MQDRYADTTNDFFSTTIIELEKPKLSLLNQTVSGSASWIQPICFSPIGQLERYRRTK